MGATPSVTFGDVLRRYRLAAGLTQENLAERAHLSPRAISDLERGARHRPWRETIRLLVTALGLGPSERAELEAAARWPNPSASDATGHSPSPDGPPSRHNLPIQVTSFVGRGREVAELTELLRGEGARPRLVTLTGTGGVGKTRLALRVAEELAPAFRDGVWLVELAPLADPKLVPQAVAAVLGVREIAGRDLSGVLVDSVRSRRLLLLLDKCEHVVAALAELAAVLLGNCPELRIVATSREILAVPGEAVWRVPSLATPDPKELPETGATLVEAVGRADAVQLFSDRARLALPSFQVTVANAAATAQICSRLDGIPLAIELAAARVRVLTVEQIAARLSDRFRLLTGGSRTALRRQQTLRALIDWSHDLLTAQEQALFRRLAVFAGGFTLEAAEAVAGDGGPGTGDSEGTRLSSVPGPPSPVPREEVLDLMTALANKSLVVVDAGTGREPRYRLLETLREYAIERLTESGEAEEVRRRHAAHYLALAEQAEAFFTGPDQVEWLDRCDAERDNLRAAIAWSWESGRADLGMRLGAALLWLWYVRAGVYSEGGPWLDRVRVAPATAAAEPVRAKALAAAVYLAVLHFDYPLAQELFATFRSICAQLGDPRTLARHHWYVARAAVAAKDYARARDLLTEGVALAREVGDRWALGQEVEGLGYLAMEQGDLAEARRLYEESLTHYRACRDWRAIAYSLQLLGKVSFQQGDHGEARRYLAENLGINRRLKDKHMIGITLRDLGVIACSEHENQQSRTCLEESLRLAREVGAAHLEGTALCALGWLARSEGKREQARSLVREGIVKATAGTFPELDEIGNGLIAAGVLAADDADYRLAARLFGRVEAMGFDPRSFRPDLRSPYEASLVAARGALGDAAFAAARAEGQAMTLEAAIAYGLEDDG